MSGEGKHIDKVFREGLMNLNVTPPADVWETVDYRISRRKIYFSPVYRLAAASVLLTMIIGSFWLIFLRKPVDRDLADQPVLSGKNPVTQTAAPAVQPEKKSASQKSQTTAMKISDEKSMQQGSTIQIAENATEAFRTTTQMEKLHTGVFSAQRKNPVTENIYQGRYGEKSLNPLLAVAPSLYVDIDMRVKEKEVPAWSMIPQPENIPDATAISTAQWSLGGSFGPLYTYRTLVSQDKYYSSYLNSQETGLISYAGGISVAYTKGESRLSLQTGVHYARMGQVANDVIAFRSIKTGDFALLETKGNEFIHVSEGKLAYDANPVFVANQTGPDGMDQAEFLLTRVGADLYEQVDVQLKQEFEFVEVPVILRYRLVDRDLRINLLGGMGSSILLSGKSHVVSGNEAVLLGNTADLRKANLNGILGVGMSYKIARSFRFRLEPTFKYYLNPLNRHSSVRAHPYSLGVYSGLSFAF